MIKMIAKRDLLIGDQILNYPGEKTTMVVVKKKTLENGMTWIEIHRLHGKKIYGCIRPNDHEFLVER